MSERKPLRFGGDLGFGGTTCGYGVDTPACHKPAVWHLYWLESNSTSPTCDEHLAFINSRSHPDYDIHTHGPNCGMPGVHWQFPYEDQKEGYCFFPANDDASALMAEEPITAEALLG
jgi:hypothetical protein